MERSEWKKVLQEAPTGAFEGLLWRAVEDQSKNATMSLVDTLEEQARLEELLDDSKPPYPENAPENYLLATPFRYPPLNWGSRFGSTTEMSIFYGSREQSTALAELAFYRLVFIEGITGTLPNPVVRARYDLFSAKFEFTPGIDLTALPFAEYATILQHKSEYRATQNLGVELRESGVEGIFYTSARCPNNGINIAVLTVEGLKSKRPEEVHRCYCEATKDHVTLKVDPRDVLQFPRDIFLVGGSLPSPA
ncbi:MAG: RES family NAD+ phosphorylase [Sneathiella sp.]